MRSYIRWECDLWRSNKCDSLQAGHRELFSIRFSHLGTLTCTEVNKSFTCRVLDSGAGLWHCCKQTKCDANQDRVPWAALKKETHTLWQYGMGAMWSAAQGWHVASAWKRGTCLITELLRKSFIRVLQINERACKYTWAGLQDIFKKNKKKTKLAMSITSRNGHKRYCMLIMCFYHPDHQPDTETQEFVCAQLRCTILPVDIF